MRVLITGATGYIGGRLAPALLEAGHAVTALARDPERLTGRFPGMHVVRGDVFDAESVRAALVDIDVAYYLIHSMSGKRDDFADSDREAARIFGAAAQAAGTQRIVYLGGLGDERASLSEHLRSRHEVGEILRASGVPVTEFRAAMIVGSGSASFEMMRYLSDRLPVMIAPKWVSTRSQPIFVRDVITYLVQALDRPATAGKMYEIGGADVLTYKQMMKRYAALRGLSRHMLVVPFFTPRLSSYWVHLVTPIPSYIARPLIDGLHNEVIVRDTSARRDFSVVPIGYDEAVTCALNRYASTGPRTTWFDAYAVRTLPGEFAGVSEGMLIDRRQRETRAPQADVFLVFEGLGGTRGWLYGDILWEIRGLLDRLVGGIGLRRGRRSKTDLRIGDALDFWRVEAYRPNELLRLRAEMKLPGKAWLEFEACPNGAGTALRQTAFFEPRGILGYAYWYSVVPFHALIFGNMAKRIVAEAELLAASHPKIINA